MGHLGTELVPRLVQHPRKGAISSPPIPSSSFTQQGKKERNKTRPRATHTQKIVTKRNIFHFPSSGLILPKDQEDKKNPRAQSQPEMDSVCENMECIEAQAQKTSQLPPQKVLV